jgi:hypothetical protein
MNSSPVTKVATDFEELKRRSQENLITFMECEVDLASTFFAMAENTSDAKHKAKLFQNVQKAVEAIHHFAKRITDRSVRAKLNRDADRIGKSLTKASG